ncbi:hypothetical protein QuyetLC_24500 [Bacillus anthracis]|uniref:Uncharacterized protein n=1 Tax=Bacillus anthracis TaxID=1392 RepID=A0A640MHL9_BACAN|nr:hypothetical protein QuyetLC_24500 [Bacillus anthracis]
MDNFSEKKLVYEQMNHIIEERRELTKQYYKWKKRLESLDNSKIEVEPIKDRKFKKKENENIFKKENEYQKYMISKNDNQSKNISFQKIGLTISSILKEAGRPLSNKEIHTILCDSKEININYKNLTMNILPKMNKDSSINVERAYRGYWQYRLRKN